jgi:desulfoferrodoxin (superoxide reductase-like protein)
MMPLFAVMVGAVDLLLTNKHWICWIKWYAMHPLMLAG